jgi:hypothetical protein
MRGRWRAIGLAVALVVAFMFWAHSLTKAYYGAANGAAVSDPAVGALLRDGQPFCTASVVNSPGGDVIITSAHCLGENHEKIRFAPGYHDGSEPYGTWATAPERFFPPGWFPGGNISLDFAFLVTRGNVQRWVGALRLGYSSPLPRNVTVDGYAGTKQLTVCTAPLHEAVKAGYEQLVFGCAGYWDASSGGPFISRLTIIGAIGGYQQGGDSPDISYSSLFGTAVHQLYQHVVSQNPGS